MRPAATALVNLSLFIALALSLAVSHASSKHRPFTRGPANNLYACSPRTFNRVSPEIWRCLKNGISLQEHLTFPNANSGRITGKATADYTLDMINQRLTVTVVSTPWFVSCDAFNNRLGEHLTDCAGPSVRQTASDKYNEVWRIDAPNVKQADTAYPQIKLRVRDTVAVDAGGCVQAGGAGKTWRLYVDPKGPSSDRFFHGRIKLPGMRESSTIRQFVSIGNNFEVPANESVDMQLHLGYEDNPNDYANNGYWGHDDGIQDQCRNIGKAWVIVRIYHH
jgi:hypothetical protein